MFFRRKKVADIEPLSREELKELILINIKPGTTKILKTDGAGRRVVTSNTGDKVAMRVGVKTNAIKTISLDMIEHAYKTTRQQGSFDSRAFREQFPNEYASGPCIYSMTGGLLVELGLAELNSGPGRSYYSPI